MFEVRRRNVISIFLVLESNTFSCTESEIDGMYCSPERKKSSPRDVLGVCTEVGLPEVGVQLVHAIKLLLKVRRTANSGNHQNE